MVERGLLIGAISQVLLVTMAIIAILPPLLLDQTFFYISHYFLTIASVFNYRFLHLSLIDVGAPNLLHFQLPSLLGILNSLLFLLLIFLLLISIRRIDHQIGSSSISKRIFSLGFASAILACVISLVFNVISLRQLPYWYSEYLFDGGHTIFVWGLSSLGWILLILENLLVGLTLVSIGFFFIITSKHFTLSKLRISTGQTYLMAGLFDFTVFIASIGVILTIIAGFFGLASFFKTEYIEVNS